MPEEIKEILDNIESLANNHTDKYGIKLDGMRLRNYELKLINDYITNLQQLYENGLKVNQNSHKYITELETKIYSCLDGIDRTIEIIKQQPTKDDSWILSRLYGFKYALNGSDNNE